MTFSLLPSSGEESEPARFAWDIHDKKIVQKWVSIPSSVIEGIPEDIFAKIDAVVGQQKFSIGDYAFEIRLRIKKDAKIVDLLHHVKHAVSMIDYYQQEEFMYGIDNPDGFNVSFHRTNKS